MLAWGAYSSRALGTRLVWVAVTSIPQAQPGEKFFLSLVNSKVTTSFVFIISIEFSPRWTSLSVFSLITIILGKTMSKEWGIHVASSRLSFSAFEGKESKTQNYFQITKLWLPKMEAICYSGINKAGKKWKEKNHERSELIA